MRRSFFAAALAAAAVTAACATTPGLRNQLSGQTVRSVTPAGQVTVQHFAADGTVHNISGADPAVVGRWTVIDDEVCFDWPGRARDCWSVGTPLRRDRAVGARSRDGRTAQVTLQ